MKRLVAIILWIALLASGTAHGQAHIIQCDPNATGSASYPNVKCASDGTLAVSGSVTSTPSGTQAVSGTVAVSGVSGNSAVVGPVASGGTIVGGPVLIGGMSGTSVLSVVTDASGRVITVGGASNGSAPLGAPVLIGGSDGTSARTIKTTTLGVVQVTTGISQSYNITAAAVVKASAGTLVKVSVITAGVAGTVNDTTTTGGAAAANEIGVIPAVVGVYEFNWPCSSGIVVVPGTGQVVSVSYN